MRKRKQNKNNIKGDGELNFPELYIQIKIKTLKAAEGSKKNNEQLKTFFYKKKKKGCIASVS